MSAQFPLVDLIRSMSAQFPLVDLIRALEMLMVLERQAIEGERLLDGLLDPGDELWGAGAPFGDPGRQISAGLLDRAPVVEPAQFLQAVVVGLARQMVEGVA